jgi:hypothetical protein
MTAAVYEAAETSDRLHPWCTQTVRGEQGPPFFEEKAGEANTNQATVEAKGAA